MLRVRTRTWFAVVVAASLLFLLGSRFDVFDPLENAVMVVAGPIDGFTEGDGLDPRGGERLNRETAEEQFFRVDIVEKFGKPGDQHPLTVAGFALDRPLLALNDRLQRDHEREHTEGGVDEELLQGSAAGDNARVCRVLEYLERWPGRVLPPWLIIFAGFCNNEARGAVYGRCKRLSARRRSWTR